MWNLLLKINRQVAIISAVIAVVLLFLACIVVTEMVYIRYILNGSTIWQTEFIVFSVVGSTLLGAPYVFLTNGHVNVDLLINNTGKNKWIFEIISNLISFIFIFILTISSWEYFIEAYSENWLSESAWAPPLWVPLISLIIGLSGLCFQILLNLLSNVFFKKSIFIELKEGV